MFGDLCRVPEWGSEARGECRRRSLYERKGDRQFIRNCVEIEGRGKQKHLSQLMQK